MSLLRFGSLYLDPGKILYVRQHFAEVKAVPPDNQGRLQIGFETGELTLYDDDPSYRALLVWLEQHSEKPPSA